MRSNMPSRRLLSVFIWSTRTTNQIPFLEQLKWQPCLSCSCINTQLCLLLLRWLIRASRLQEYQLHWHPHTSRPLLNGKIWNANSALNCRPRFSWGEERPSDRDCNGRVSHDKLWGVAGGRDQNPTLSPTKCVLCTTDLLYRVDHMCWQHLSGSIRPRLEEV